MIFEDYNPNTPICADWLNQVDRTVFTALGASNTAAEVRAFLALVGEAPLDGSTYGRKSGQWVALVGGGTPGDAVLLSPPNANYNQILVTDPSYRGLIIKGAGTADHTENYFEIRNRLGDLELFVDENGALTVGPDYTTNASAPAPTPGVTLLHTGVVSLVGQTARTEEVSSYGLLRVQPDANTHGIVIKLDASPVQNALDIINKDNTRIGFIDKEGSFYAGAGASTGWSGLVGGGNANLACARGGAGSYPQLLIEADNYQRKLVYNPYDSTASNNQVFGLYRTVGGVSTSCAQMRTITSGGTIIGVEGTGYRDTTNTYKGWWQWYTTSVSPHPIYSLGFSTANELQPGSSVLSIKARENGHIQAGRFEANDTGVGFAQFFAYTNSSGANHHHFFGSNDYYPGGDFVVSGDNGLCFAQGGFSSPNAPWSLMRTGTYSNLQEDHTALSEIKKLRVMSYVGPQGRQFGAEPVSPSVLVSEFTTHEQADESLPAHTRTIVRIDSLSFALAEAVQELDARLVALEAGGGVVTP